MEKLKQYFLPIVLIISCITGTMAAWEAWKRAGSAKKAKHYVQLFAPVLTLLWFAAEMFGVVDMVKGLGKDRN